MNYFVVLISLLCFSCFAQSKEKSYLIDNITIGLGNWTAYHSDVQTNSNGSTNSFWDFKLLPYFSIALDYQLNEKWALIPELGYIYFDDSGTSYFSKNQYILRLDLSYKAYSWLRLRVGSSLMIQTFSGQGGEKTIQGPMGNETYFVASERSTSLNQTLDFSVEYIFDRVSIKYASYMYGINKHSDSMVSMSFTLNYSIPLKEL